MIKRVVFPAVAAVLLLAPVGAHAQGLGIDRLRHNGIITVNPIAVLAGAINGDVELNLGSGVTGSLGGTHWPDEYSSLDLTFRYYPNELNPQGFWIGGSVGHVNWDPNNDNSEHTKGATVGFHIGYNWIMGRSERLAIATGVGAKRVFASRDRYPNRQTVLPSGRFGIGITF